ncbi:MAG: hypothetical protein DRP60_05220 [Spirochaetes bacterium]|nr:MAG: hypothetical protein DRP60_05220 [Spirochaetota bacterium]
MLLLIARIIGAFSSYGKPRMIAFSMAVGITLAFIPGLTLLWFVLFIPMMLVRLNQAAFLGMMAAGKLFMPFVDPFSERLGYFILSRPGLYEPMGRFLSLPGTNWFRLNDSFVTGGFVLGITGWPFWFLISLILVGLYRRYLAVKVKTLFSKLGGKVPLLKKLSIAVSAGRRIGGAA